MVRYRSQLIDAHRKAVRALDEMRDARKRFEEAESYFRYVTELEMMDTGDGRTQQPAR